MANDSGSTGTALSRTAEAPPALAAATGSASAPSYIGVPDGYAWKDASFKPTFEGPTGRWRASADQSVGAKLRTGAFSSPSGAYVENMAADGYAPVRSPKYTSGSESSVAMMSTENLARLQSRMAQAGLLGSNQSVRVGVADDNTVAAYKTLLAYANRYGLDADSALTQMLRQPLAKTGEDGVLGSGAGAAEDEKKGPVTTTSEQRNVTLTDRSSAKKQLMSAAQDLIGRAVTDTEVDGFLAGLNAQEKANPSVSKTTQTVDENGNSTVSTMTTPSAVDAALMAGDKLKAGPDYAAYQAGTTYMNALQSAIASPFSMGG